jgi:hypothetical protein
MLIQYINRNDDKNILSNSLFTINVSFDVTVQPIQFKKFIHSSVARQPDVGPVFFRSFRHSSLFRSEFLQSVQKVLKHKSSHFMIGAGKTKYSGLNSNKHSLCLICSQLLCEWNFDLLFLFQNIWTLPHFHMIY